MNNKPILWLIVPCYNEQEVLPVTAPLFLNKIISLTEKNIISEQSRILFVNDGSTDNTWEIIKKLSLDNPIYKGICQSRNRGHQNALLAGLMEAKDNCDVTISIDCDGQDDINATDKMLDEYLKGAEIVYGVRNDRETDTWFKKNTAELFYKLLRFFGTETVYNHADYRLVSSKVLQHFSDYKEVNLFLRGMFPLVGFKSTCVYYERAQRVAGESHYKLTKMLSLAVDGITSLSVKPISALIILGLIFAIIGILLISLIFTGIFISYISLIIGVILLVGGIQIIAIGIVGIYVGKVYMEAKGRPRYIISERTDNDKK